jgi:hypothetical protein
MKHLTTLISALFFLVIGASHVLALPNCEGLYNALRWDNCVGTYLWSSGEQYVGEFKDGKQHGQGNYTYVSGENYAGEFKENKYHGRGTFTFANGMVKEGIFKDDKFLYTQKKSKVDKHKEFCEEIGFTPKTEGFGNCVLELMKKD